MADQTCHGGPDPSGEGVPSTQGREQFIDRTMDPTQAESSHNTAQVVPLAPMSVLGSHPGVELENNEFQGSSLVPYGRPSHGHTGQQVEPAYQPTVSLERTTPATQYDHPQGPVESFHQSGIRDIDDPVTAHGQSSHAVSMPESSRDPGVIGQHAAGLTPRSAVDQPGPQEHLPSGAKLQASSSMQLTANERKARELVLYPHHARTQRFVRNHPEEAERLVREHGQKFLSRPVMAASSEN